MTLTRYKEGSWLELVKIATPLILSSFSLSLMLFVDRLFLVQYDQDSLSYIVTSGALSWVFIHGFSALAGATEIFVSRNNGAGRYHKLGEPVWQMIWVTVFTIPLFLLNFWKGAAFWTAIGYFNYEREGVYFQWIMLFGFGYPLYAALCGFFIGKGKTQIITLSVIFGNIVNFAFDWILIFGIEGVIPAFGMKGAALATSLGTLMQALFLFTIFLSPKNRETFGTGNFHINFPLMKKCVAIALPKAVFIGIEIFGWATFYSILFRSGVEYALVGCLCQNLWIFFYCFNEGISKAIITLSGNLIGAGKTSIIPKMIWLGVRTQLMFLCFMILCHLCFFDLFVDYFLCNFGTLVNNVYNTLWVSALFIIAHLFLDGIRLLYSGVLTAYKDTIFLMYACSFSIWMFLVVPTYFLLMSENAHMIFAAFLHVFYSVCLCLICFGRYIQQRWIEEPKPALATA
jgi:MATE family multidrug resistance protein